MPRKQIEWKDAQKGDWAVGNRKEFLLRILYDCCLGIDPGGGFMNLTDGMLAQLGFHLERDVEEEPALGSWGWQCDCDVHDWHVPMMPSCPKCGTIRPPLPDDVQPAPVTAGPMKVWKGTAWINDDGEDWVGDLEGPYTWVADDTHVFVCDRDPNAEIERLNAELYDAKAQLSETQATIQDYDKTVKKLTAELAKAGAR